MNVELQATVDTEPRSAAEASRSTDKDGAIEAAAAKAGSLAATAFVATARAIRRGVEAVDPDLRAHILQLPFVGVTNFGPADDDIRPLPDDGHAPVLLVHGLAGHPSNFLLVRARLAWAGRKRVYAVDLRDLADVHQMAARVRSCVEAVLAINALPPGSRVDLIGHSLGGLVSRLAVDDPQTAGRVRCLVTIGTPHQGTWAARFAGGPIARSLRPESPLFAEPWTPPPSVRVTTIVAENDVMVTPNWHAELPGCEVVRLPGRTHFSVMAHPSALDAIVKSVA